MGKTPVGGQMYICTGLFENFKNCYEQIKNKTSESIFDHFIISTCFQSLYIAYSKFLRTRLHAHTGRITNNAFFQCQNHCRHRISRTSTDT